MQIFRKTILNHGKWSVKLLASAVFFLSQCLFASGALSQESTPDDLSKRLQELETAEANLQKELGEISGQNRPNDSPPVKEANRSVENINSDSKASLAESPVQKGEQQQSKKAVDTSPIQKAVQGVQEATRSVQQENLDLRKKYALSQQNLASLQERYNETKSKLTESESRASEAQEQLRRLAKELDEARARLMLAETEVERLSARYGNRANNTAAQVQGDRGRSLYPSEGPSSGPVDIGRMPGSVTKDLPLATVLTESASLRTGPGAQYSTLMTVPKGQSLAVEGRQGEWLRIITPLGARAWVNSAAVQTGGLPQKAPLEKQQVPSGPKTSNEQEDAAFHSLNSALQQNK